MRVCVLIPAYNEACAIAALVEAVRAQGLDVLVVDDGSGDNTAALAAGAGARVLRHPCNQGKGNALRTGFSAVCQSGYDGVIILDGDGQHRPEEIPRFLTLAAAEPAVDVVVGNRMGNPVGMPWLRRLTNRFTSWCISRVCGLAIPDSQCGFRFLRCRVLDRVELVTGRYDTESELLLTAARQGFLIRSLPVSSVYTAQRSHIHPGLDTLRFARLLLTALGRRRAEKRRG